MLCGNWWLPAVSPELSQGDILSEYPLGASLTPPRFLHSNSHTKNGRTTWTQDAWTPDHNGIGHFVARGKMAPLLVVTHSCEVDKARINDARVAITVAPIRPLSDFAEDQRQQVLDGARRAYVPIHGVPNGLPDSYADLRYAGPMPAKLAETLTRMASMSPDGIATLHGILVEFYSRKSGDLT